VRGLFVHLLHFTSLIFPHSHLLCWFTCLDGKSISQNPFDQGGILTRQPCLHLMLDIIMWFESLGTKMFFRVGEEKKVRRCQIRAVGRVLKNFHSPIIPKDYCRMSCMRSDIVMQQQHPLVWHLRPLAFNSCLKFFESGQISSRIDCFIRSRKVQYGSAIGNLTFWLPLVFCGSTIHREHIVSFSWQHIKYFFWYSRQWGVAQQYKGNAFLFSLAGQKLLHKWATLFRDEYVAY